MEEDTHPRSTPRMKNSSTSPPHYHLMMRKVMMMMVKNKIVRMLVRKNQVSRKRMMKIGVMTRMRIMMKMGIHLEKIAVRMVAVQLKKYHHHEYHPLYFPLRSLGAHH